mmetsp:Transcript_79801/g.222146  ORF Transcript_79801/g.222146 Transcript_79801/m.222146 type:complete len:83 (-) Transcript_79801:1600-1848(-)
MNPLTGRKIIALRLKLPACAENAASPFNDSSATADDEEGEVVLRAWRPRCRRPSKVSLGLPREDAQPIAAWVGSCQDVKLST